MPKLLFAALFAAIPLSALGQTPPPEPAPAVTASPVPAQSASPSPSPVPSATISPAPLPTPLVLLPAEPPQILAIAINASEFHSGDTFSAMVVTSTNVPAVELRILGKVIRFQRLDFGIFQLSYKLPHIPRRFLHDYAAQIVAWNTTNLTTSRDITISLR
jgi:hypothetical protein